MPTKGINEATISHQNITKEYIGSTGNLSRPDKTSTNPALSLTNPAKLRCRHIKRESIKITATSHVQSCIKLQAVTPHPEFRGVYYT